MGWLHALDHWLRRYGFHIVRNVQVPVSMKIDVK
jgi:hypothetical protein